MLMFGPKLNTVFASRWKALFWAAGVMATAYCTIPAAEDAESAASVQNQAAPADQGRSPWAADGPASAAPSQ